MAERWIVIPNWDRFQHYGNRRPVWLKLYTELLHKAEWRRLSAVEQALLVNVWLVYAHSGGTVSTLSAQQSVPFATRRRHWDSLVREGFIKLCASKAIARRYQNARAEKEREVLRTSLKSSASARPSKSGPAPAQEQEIHNELLTAARTVAQGWNGGGSDAFADRLDQLEREHHARFTHAEREDLWERAFQG